MMSGVSLTLDMTYMNAAPGELGHAVYINADTLI
jgi:hypothetical protein